MSDQNQNVLNDDGLPPNFWAVPENFIQDESLRFMHAEMCIRLKQENPGADSLELMAIERIATLYFYLRSRELAGAGAMRSDAAYKDMLKLFTSMATELRKNRVGSQNEDDIRNEILSGVSGAIKGAFQGVDVETAAVVKKRLAERLGQL
jgi:hypothetical protein